MLVVDDIKYKTRRNLVNKTVAYDHNASGAITIDASGTNAISIGSDANTGDIPRGPNLVHMHQV